MATSPTSLYSTPIRCSPRTLSAQELTPGDLERSLGLEYSSLRSKGLPEVPEYSGNGADAGSGFPAGSSKTGNLLPSQDGANDGAAVDAVGADAVGVTREQKLVLEQLWARVALLEAQVAGEGREFVGFAAAAPGGHPDGGCSYLTPQHMNSVSTPTTGEGSTGGRRARRHSIDVAMLDAVKSKSQPTTPAQSGKKAADSGPHNGIFDFSSEYNYTEAEKRRFQDYREGYASWRQGKLVGSRGELERSVLDRSQSASVLRERLSDMLSELEPLDLDESMSPTSQASHLSQDANPMFDTPPQTPLRHRKKSPVAGVQDEALREDDADFHTPTNSTTSTGASYNDDGTQNIDSSSQEANPTMLRGSSFFQSLWPFLRVQLRGHNSHPGAQPTEPDEYKRMHELLSVPLHLEKLLAHGVVVCLDSQLWTLTMLPLRVAWAVILLPTLMFRLGKFQARHGHDLLRALLVMICCACLAEMQMSRVYHFIRNQDLIKLYVLTAMLEIFDKLCCAFGQEVLDSLFWTCMATKTKKRRLVLDFCVACCYMVIHSLLLFVHVVTLNVALNSRSNALLTLLISSQFSEIKTSVFKKFEEQNLFQMSCSDVTERFKLCLFLGLIILQQYVLVGSAGGDDSDFWYIVLAIFVAEVIVDAIKHSFILKFNRIDSDVYGKYRNIFARDLASCCREHVSRDHTHVVARRLGLSSLPIACLVIHMLRISLGSTSFEFTSPIGVAAATATFSCFILFKLLLGLLLTAHAAYVDRTFTAGNSLNSPRQRTRYLEYLASLERYTMWRNRVV